MTKKSNGFNKYLEKLSRQMEDQNIIVPLLLILSGVLLLYQFLIPIIGPLCIGLGALYFWDKKSDHKEETKSENDQPKD